MSFLSIACLSFLMFGIDRLQLIFIVNKNYWVDHHSLKKNIPFL